MVLSELAKTFQNAIRELDSAARWGGEEFLLLLPETDSEGGLTVAEKLRTTIEEQKIQYQSKQLHITMTFGITSCQEPNTPNECIKRADEALYRGKVEGRNRCIIYSKEY